MSLKSKLGALKLIKDQFGVGYFHMIYKYFLGDKKINVSINNVTIKITLFQAYAAAFLLKNGWRLTKAEDNFITFENEKENVSLTCRSDKGGDIGHIVEIFLDDAYNFDVKGKIVVDVGMSNGDSSIYFAKRGAKKVIGLEPDEESFNLAIKNIRASKVEDVVIPLNKALAPKREKVQFYVYENSINGNSIDPQNMVKLNERVVVKEAEAISLDSIVEMAGASIGLLKLDCEGCEYSVLSSFSDFDKIDAIIMEYHNGLQNLPEILAKNGFKVEMKNPQTQAGILKAYKSYDYLKTL